MRPVAVIIFAVVVTAGVLIGSLLAARLLRDRNKANKINKPQE